MILALLASVAIAIAADGCIKRRDTQGDRRLKGRSVEQVFDIHRDRLLSIPGVVGAGIAKLDDQPSIIIMVRERTPGLDSQIPTELDGFPVVIEVTGEFKALNDSL